MDSQEDKKSERRLERISRGSRKDGRTSSHKQGYSPLAASGVQACVTQLTNAPAAVENKNCLLCLPLSGPVAQLGARFHGMEEVVGSIPTRSTNLSTT